MVHVTGLTNLLTSFGIDYQIGIALSLPSDAKHVISVATGTYERHTLFGDGEYKVYSFSGVRYSIYFSHIFITVGINVVNWGSFNPDAPYFWQLGYRF